MSFQVFDWELLIVSFITSYSTLLIQTLAYNATTDDWHAWYENNCGMLFEKSRCMNQGLEALLIFASSVGFFFTLHDPMGSASPPGLMWNYAVATYLVLTALDGLWLVPLWHYRSTRLATVTLYAAMGAAYTFVALALTGTSSPIACAIPVLPRGLWLSYHAAMELFVQRRQAAAFIGDKKQEDYSVHDEQHSSVEGGITGAEYQPRQSRSQSSMTTRAPVQSAQVYSQHSGGGPAYNQTYHRQPHSGYLNPMDQCPVVDYPSGAAGWRRATDGTIFFFSADGMPLGRKEYVTLD